MHRIDKDNYYLEIAEAVAKRSTCIRRKYGAVIVKNDEIISTGYNGSPRGELNCCDTGICKREELHVPKGERYELCVAVHAEQNAIISTSRDRMLGGTLYITGIEVKSNEKRYANPIPCMICSRLIKNAGIAKVVGRKEDGSIVYIDVSSL